MSRVPVLGLASRRWIVLWGLLDVHPEQLNHGVRKAEAVLADEALEGRVEGLQLLLQVQGALAAVKPRSTIRWRRDPLRGVGRWEAERRLGC